jgi:uncharacterized protein YggT (Ycf19 family)
MVERSRGFTWVRRVVSRSFDRILTPIRRL